MNINFCKNFATLRKINGYTQESIAEKCGVSRQAITKWESGSSLPDMYKLVDISKIFDISLDELVCSNSFSDIDTKSDLENKIDAVLASTRSILQKMPADENINGLFEYYCYNLDHQSDDEADEFIDIFSEYTDIVDVYNKSGYEKALDVIVTLITTGRGSLPEALNQICELSSELRLEYYLDYMNRKPNENYLRFLDDLSNIFSDWSKIIQHEINLAKIDPSHLARG